MPLHTYYIAYSFFFKEHNKTNFGEDVEKLELLYIVGGDTNGFTAVENSLLVPHKIKHRSTI